MGGYCCAVGQRPVVCRGAAPGERLAGKAVRPTFGTALGQRLGKLVSRLPMALFGGLALWAMKVANVGMGTSQHSNGSSVMTPA